MAKANKDPRSQQKSIGSSPYFPKFNRSIYLPHIYLRVIFVPIVSKPMSCTTKCMYIQIVNSMPSALPSINFMWSLQLEEINTVLRSHSWEAGEQNIIYSNQPGHLHSNGTLHIG